jgi:hypothetical protein
MPVLRRKLLAVTEAGTHSHGYSYSHHCAKPTPIPTPNGYTDPDTNAKDLLTKVKSTDNVSQMCRNDHERVARLARHY